MLDRIIKFVGWFLSAICVFYTIESMVHQWGWSSREPELLFAFYKTLCMFCGFAIYFKWIKKGKTN